MVGIGILDEDDRRLIFVWVGLCRPSFRNIGIRKLDSRPGTEYAELDVAIVFSYRAAGSRTRTLTHFTRKGSTPSDFPQVLTPAVHAAGLEADITLPPPLPDRILDRRESELSMRRFQILALHGQVRGAVELRPESHRLGEPKGDGCLDRLTWSARASRDRSRSGWQKFADGFRFSIRVAKHLG